jgi:hypothetical protein
MEKINLIILIFTILLILFIVDNYHEKKIIKNNEKGNDKVKINNILDKNNDFYKKNFTTISISDTELNKLNISRGNITRQSIISENGGSNDYKNFIIDSNISGDKINYQKDFQTYGKLPSKIRS